MDPSPAQGEDEAPPPRGAAQERSLLGTVAELPSRLLLAIASAGVIIGLTLGAASVWLSATIDRVRRR